MRQDAIDYRNDPKLTELIKKLHSEVFRNSMSSAGEFRQSAVSVVNTTTGEVYFIAPSPNQVGALAHELEQWDVQAWRKYHPLVRAAVIHNQFLTIHPFEDGNGRVSRLMLARTMLYHNLMPINIQLENRDEYYAAIMAYQQHGAEMQPTINLFLKVLARDRPLS
jgi:Fic family protein